MNNRELIELVIKRYMSNWKSKEGYIGRFVELLMVFDSLEFKGTETDSQGKIAFNDIKFVYGESETYTLIIKDENESAYKIIIILTNYGVSFTVEEV